MVMIILTITTSQGRCLPQAASLMPDLLVSQLAGLRADRCVNLYGLESSMMGSTYTFEVSLTLTNQLSIPTKSAVRYLPIFY